MKNKVCNQSDWRFSLKIINFHEAKSDWRLILKIINFHEAKSYWKLSLKMINFHEARMNADITNTVSVLYEWSLKRWGFVYCLCASNYCIQKMHIDNSQKIEMKQIYVN